MNKKVSIIVTTHNRPEHCSRAVESLFRQSYKIIEIIVIDDASSASYESFLNKYKDKVIYFRRSKNSKVVGESFRNDGLKIATGDYICYLDDDNLYRRDFIEKFVKFFESHVDCDFAYCDFIINTSINGNERRLKIFSKDYDVRSLRANNFIDVNCVFYKRSLLEKIPPWRPISKGYEDGYYAEEVARVSKIYHLKEYLLEYMDCNRYGTEKTKYYDDMNFVPENFDNKPDKVSIIILTKDNFNFTKQLIDSIEIRTVCDYELIVVDSGSTDQTENFFKNCKNTKFLKFNDEFIFSRNVNRGIDASEGKYVCEINNDCEVLKSYWLLRMIKKLESNDKLMFVGSHDTSVKFENGMFEFLRFFCVLFKRESFKKIGYLDERLIGYGYDDNEYSWRCRKLGYLYDQTEDVSVKHYVCKTFQASNAVSREPLLQKNKSIYENIINEKLSVCERKMK